MPKIAKKTALSHLQGGQQYDWNEWLDGIERIFTARVDFICQPDSFVRQARLAAALKGLKVAATITNPGHGNTRGVPVKVHLQSYKEKK